MPETFEVEEPEEEKQSESKWWLVGLGAWAAVSTVAAILFFVLWMCAPGSGQNLALTQASAHTMQWYVHSLYGYTESFLTSTNEAAKPNTDLCGAAMENILTVSGGEVSTGSLCVMWDTPGKCSYQVTNRNLVGQGIGEALWVVHNLFRNPAEVKKDNCPTSWEQQVIAFGDGMISFFSNDAVMPFRFVLPDHLDTRMHAAKAHEKCMQAAGLVGIEFDMVVSGLYLLKAALFDKFDDETKTCKNVQTMKTAIDEAAKMKIGRAAAVKTAGQKLNFEERFKPSVWDDFVWDFLIELISQKFTKHENGAYVDLLKATQNFILAEALSTETVFAVNLEVGSEKLQKVRDWPAAPNTNMQGAALMQVREQLQNVDKLVVHFGEF